VYVISTVASPSGSYIWWNKHKEFKNNFAAAV